MVLKSVQILAAEDTRRTAGLLAHIQHRVPELISLHAHNEGTKSQSLIERLLAGDDVAIVSDAGTPLLNDPGFPLIQAAHAAGIQTVPIPGCCSITTALSICPLPATPFCYVGFLPSKSKSRQRQLANLIARGDAIVFLESPNRILATLKELGQLTQRQVFVGRELTKQYETTYVGSADSVAERLGDNPKGEITCIVEAGAERGEVYAHEPLMRALLQALPPSQAAKVAASILNINKSELYDLALKLGKA